MADRPDKPWCITPIVSGFAIGGTTDDNVLNAYQSWLDEIRESLA